MDYDREINRLAGENLALQWIVVALCAKLRGEGHLEAVTIAFDDAANALEMLTIRMGRSIPSDHLAHSLRVVEDLRAQVMKYPVKPKD